MGPNGQLATDVVAGAADLAQLNVTDKRTWKSQERFLEQYRKTRTKTTSAKFAGVSREAARLWERGDKLGFVARLAEADEVFCDKLEEIGLERIHKQAENAHPLLYITFLNANIPHKYRPNTVVLDDEDSKDIRADLKKLVNQGKRKPKDEDGSVPMRETRM